MKFISLDNAYENGYISAKNRILEVYKNFNIEIVGREEKYIKYFNNSLKNKFIRDLPSYIKYGEGKINAQDVFIENELNNMNKLGSYIPLFNKNDLENDIIYLKVCIDHIIKNQDKILEKCEILD